MNEASSDPSSGRKWVESAFRQPTKHISSAAWREKNTYGYQARAFQVFFNELHDSLKKLSTLVAYPFSFFWLFLFDESGFFFDESLNAVESRLGGIVGVGFSGGRGAASIACIRLNSTGFRWCSAQPFAKFDRHATADGKR